jgi:hypothetical protein
MINMFYAFGALFLMQSSQSTGRDFCPPDFTQYGSANVTGIRQKARFKV